jgi:hypothetical protein
MAFNKTVEKPENSCNTAFIMLEMFSISELGD